MSDSASDCLCRAGGTSALQRWPPEGGLCKPAQRLHSCAWHALKTYHAAQAQWQQPSTWQRWLPDKGFSESSQICQKVAMLACFQGPVMLCAGTASKGSASIGLSRAGTALGASRVYSGGRGVSPLANCTTNSVSVTEIAHLVRGAWHAEQICHAAQAQL